MKQASRPGRWLAVLCAVAWLEACAFSSSDGARAEGDRAARAWLAYADRGDFSGTWQQASTWLRAKTPAEGWADAMGSVAAQVGPLRERKLHALRFTSELENALEPGEFVVAQYASEFERAPVSETLILHREEGVFRVMGYLVLPR